MKKIVFAFIAIAVLAVLLQGQEVTIRDNTPFHYAYLECKGSYAQIPDKIGEFMGAFFKQGLMPAGNFFGMYLNSPGQVKEEELQWRLGFPVAANAVVAAPLLKGECTAAKMAVYLYVGPYDKVGLAYGKIMESVDAGGYKPAGPAMEKYLDQDPGAVKPEELRTEINLPVEKK
jgi:effector-binding domain-containing protein